MDKLDPIIVSESVQEFNGRRYYRYAGRPYFQRGDKSGVVETTIAIHRAVWMYHNGDIPKGKGKWHVHHKDGDGANNCIENLELLDNRKHLGKHWKDPVWAIRQAAVMKAGRNKKLGKQWHSDHIGSIWKNTPAKEYVCTNCGKTFTGVYVREFPNHHCSPRCRQIYKYKRQKKRGTDGHVAV